LLCCCCAVQAITIILPLFLIIRCVAALYAWRRAYVAANEARAGQQQTTEGYRWCLQLLSQYSRNRLSAGGLWCWQLNSHQAPETGLHPVWVAGETAAARASWGAAGQAVHCDVMQQDHHGCGGSEKCLASRAIQQQLAGTAQVRGPALALLGCW